MNQAQRGPREGCEDVYCSFKECGYSKQCMNDCITEKADSIKECCINECVGNNAECIQACQKRMVFGQQRSAQMEQSIEVDWVLALLLILAAVLLL